MTWTYRVIRDENGGHRIAEVYTGESSPMWTETPCYPWGDDLEELRRDMALMLEAFDKPVLDEATLRESTRE